MQWSRLTRGTYSPLQRGGGDGRETLRCDDRCNSCWSNRGPIPRPRKQSQLRKSRTQSNVLVNRATEGDRLPLKRTSTALLPVAAKAQPPVGCDPAFSRVADPAREHVWSLRFVSCKLPREALMLKMRIIAGFEVAEILMLATGILLVAAIVFAI